MTTAPTVADLISPTGSTCVAVGTKASCHCRGPSPFSSRASARDMKKPSESQAIAWDPEGSWWRYRWDLNPRCAFTHTTFRELHLRPLGHGTEDDLRRDRRLGQNERMPLPPFSGRSACSHTVGRVVQPSRILRATIVAGRARLPRASAAALGWRRFRARLTANSLVLNETLPVHSKWWRDHAEGAGRAALRRDRRQRGAGHRREPVPTAATSACSPRRSEPSPVAPCASSTSACRARRSALAVQDQLPRFVTLKPDVVTVAIGANDIAGWDPAAFERGIRTIFAALPPHAIVADLPYFYFPHNERKVAVANRIVRARGGRARAHGRAAARDDAAPGHPGHAHAVRDRHVPPERPRLPGVGRCVRAVARGAARRAVHDTGCRGTESRAGRTSRAPRRWSWSRPAGCRGRRLGSGHGQAHLRIPVHRVRVDDPQVGRAAAPSASSGAPSSRQPSRPGIVRSRARRSPRAPTRAARPITEVDTERRRAPAERHRRVRPRARRRHRRRAPRSCCRGEPGVGKSTLLLEVAARVARRRAARALRERRGVHGQVRLRAERTGALHDELYLAAETDLATILGHVDEVRPELLIVDSVQTVSSLAVRRPGRAAEPGARGRLHAHPRREGPQPARAPRRPRHERRLDRRPAPPRAPRRRGVPVRGRPADRAALRARAQEPLRPDRRGRMLRDDRRRHRRGARSLAACSSAARATP